MVNSADNAGLAQSVTRDGCDFIEFGCGAGKSLPFIQTLAGGQGFGLDISEDAVSACRNAGHDAQLGNLLSYQEKNAATGTFAIDLLPEIGDRLDFELAVSRLILAARNYTFIQHNSFDADGLLVQSGLQASANFGKRIRFKPGIADYVSLISRIATSHSVSGLAIFGFGEPRLAPLHIGAEHASDFDAVQVPAGVYRTLRVVIGRKDPARFRSALRKTRMGRQLYFWEAEE